jgi:hypothetical protein
MIHTIMNIKLTQYDIDDILSMRRSVSRKLMERQRKMLKRDFYQFCARIYGVHWKTVERRLNDIPTPGRYEDSAFQTRHGGTERPSDILRF